MALLEAQELTILRGDEPLFERISLVLERGEVLQIEGANGSGKTTLLRALCALVQLDDGVILWEGSDLLKNRTSFLEQSIYLGHKPGIKNELNAIENLQTYQSIGTGSSGQSIEWALEKMEISHRQYLPCGVLSAGQRRRVALARLLLEKVTLWVLDEPLTSLDQPGRDLVASMVEHHALSGGAVLYSTHHALALKKVKSRSIRLDA